MTWNSSMYSKSLQNKFLILVAVSVHLRFWSLSRPKRIWGQCWNGGVCYFGAFHLTEENYAPNESAAQTVPSRSFDLQLLSIVFAWWHRQFWHFHLVATGPWNFNCCQNTNFAGPLFWYFSSYRRKLCTKWISSSNCTINKLWFTATFNSFCMVTQTILTFSPCRHRTVKF